jgi:hypothetical protein
VTYVRSKINCYPDNWLDTSPNLKPYNNHQPRHHLGSEFRPEMSTNTWVCTCVFACIERSSWLDPGRDHGDGVTFNNNCGKGLHDDLACPNTTSTMWLIINYYNSHMHMGQSERIYNSDTGSHTPVFWSNPPRGAN